MSINSGGILAANITITGEAYTFAGSGTLTLSNSTWEVGSGLTNAVSAALSGSSGLIKAGGGILSLSGTNKTFTGDVTVNGGAILISSAAAGSLGASNTTQLKLDGGTLGTQFATNTTVNHAITVGASGGELRNLGTDSQRFTFASNKLNGSGTLTLSFGTNNTRFVMGTTTQTNFTGKWVMNSGGSVNRFVDADGASTFGKISGDEAITLVNSGTILFRGTRTYGSGYGITVGSGGGNLATGGSQTVTLAAKVSGAATNPLRFDLGSSSSVLLLVNTNNAWLGTTTLANQGTLRLGASGVIADNAGTLDMGTTTRLDLNGCNETIGGLSGSGTVDNQAASTASILTVGANGQNAYFSGTLTNSGTGASLRLVKLGTGTQSLSGTNSLIGGMEVRAGVLHVLAPSALGGGNLELGGGSLILQGAGTYTIQALQVTGSATLDMGSRGAVLEIAGIAFSDNAKLFLANSSAGKFRLTGNAPTPTQLHSIRFAGNPDFSAVLAPDGSVEFPGIAVPLWWDNYPLIVENASAARAIELNADCTFSATYGDPSWGIYAQRVAASGDIPTQMHASGLNHIAYYEAFGESTSFAIELGAVSPEGYNTVSRTYWNWHTVAPQGGAYRWAGPHNYFDAEDFCGTYTRLHPTYGGGGRAMTYPDGSPATGYIDNDRSDPRKSRVHDAAGSKDVLGNLAINYGYRDEVAGDPQKSAGLLGINGHLAGQISIGKDTACPIWIDQQRSSILHSVDAGGIDGIWADNFSAWDNFGYPPVKVAFGEWSVARFREYLTNHFSTGELASMGISNASTFDVRTALRARLATLGGNSSNLDDPAWNNSSWLDDPVWSAYKIFKRQTGTGALANYYTATKQAAAQMGRPDFAVFGNDIPLFSLGFVRGELDAVSTELSPGWHMGVNSRGFMLPPLGRFAPSYKLGREHAKSRILGVWMYLDGTFAACRERPGIVKTLYYEMLANHTLPMLHEGNDRTTQDTAINSGFFSFVKSARGIFGARTPRSDIGLYYSASSLLANMTPSGFLDMDNQAHAGGFFGWATALGNLHWQFRAVPEWKLSADTLAGLRVLVLPDAEVLDSAEVGLIDSWVQDGGRLIVTGNTGARAGETGNFARNTSLSTAGLTGVASLPSAPATRSSIVGNGRVYFVRENIGLNYFNASTVEDRAARLGAFSQALANVLDGRITILAPHSAIPETVGINLYEDAGSRRLFVDLNNYDVDLATDAVTPAPRMTFSVEAPEWLKPAEDTDLRITTLSPDNPPAATVVKDGNDRLLVTVDAFTHYASVVITSASYYPAVEAPTISPPGGAFHIGPIPVTVDCASAGATVRYTLDGSEPLETSPQVASGSVLQALNPGTVKARAWMDNPSRTSSVAMEHFALTPFGQWAGGLTGPERISLNKYALGGAASPSGESEQPSVQAADDWLELRAVVRTNDSGLRVRGATASTLAAGALWSTNGVTVTGDPDQSNVPEEHQRRIFSIPRTGKDSAFLRLQIELNE